MQHELRQEVPSLKRTWRLERVLLAKKPLIGGPLPFLSVAPCRRDPVACRETGATKLPGPGARTGDVMLGHLWCAQEVCQTNPHQWCVCHADRLNSRPPPSPRDTKSHRLTFSKERMALNPSKSGKSILLDIVAGIS